MKTKILAGLLLAGSTMFAAPRISFGIGFGTPAPVVAPVVAGVPPCPGPGYEFIDGYWQFTGGPAYFRQPVRVEHFDRDRVDRGHGDRDDHFRR